MSELLRNQTSARVAALLRHFMVLLNLVLLGEE